ncbi:MAG TPA: UDP-N-acetylglucosamine 2-epimerase (non-hydrolyzing) [Desulfuromonadaceae bacterium]
MIKIVSIFGTRPEAIKMVPVLLELAAHPQLFQSKICVTAQHRQMLDRVLQPFAIIPDHDLDIMVSGQDLFDVTCSIMKGLKKVLSIEKPHMVLVHGDTTTTLAASLAAYYLKISVGHIEAGLRTGNKFAPFPEEINRKLTGTLADLHFAPTTCARQNLLAEGVDDSTIYITGNTGIDALLAATCLLNSSTGILQKLNAQFSYLDPGKRLILVTGHRRENFGDAFEQICLALLDIADKCPDVNIVYPVHLNPNIQEPVRRILENAARKNIYLIQPVDYLPFVYLMNRSTVIITDSGGVQEEAPSLGKPVLIMRETSERPEAVEFGTARLVGANRELIVSETLCLLNNPDAYQSMSMVHNPYGDGTAAKRICEILRKQGVGSA